MESGWRRALSLRNVAKPGVSPWELCHGNPDQKTPGESPARMPGDGGALELPVGGLCVGRVSLQRKWPAVTTWAGLAPLHAGVVPIRCRAGGWPSREVKRETSDPLPRVSTVGS